MLKEFIVNYWIEAIFSIVLSIITGWCTSMSRTLRARKKEQDKEYEALKTAMKAILHDRLFQLCNHHLALGYIPVEKAEEIMDNAKMVYDAYHALGGNGTGTEIYNKFKSLKIKKIEKED